MVQKNRLSVALSLDYFWFDSGPGVMKLVLLTQTFLRILRLYKIRAETKKFTKLNLSEKIKIEFGVRIIWNAAKSVCIIFD